MTAWPREYSILTNHLVRTLPVFRHSMANRQARDQTLKRSKRHQDEDEVSERPVKTARPSESDRAASDDCSDLDYMGVNETEERIRSQALQRQGNSPSRADLTPVPVRAIASINVDLGTMDSLGPPPPPNSLVTPQNRLQPGNVEVKDSFAIPTVPTLPPEIERAVRTAFKDVFDHQPVAENTYHKDLNEAVPVARMRSEDLIVLMRAVIEEEQQKHATRAASRQRDSAPRSKVPIQQRRTQSTALKSATSDRHVVYAIPSLSSESAEDVVSEDKVNSELDVRQQIIPEYADIKTRKRVAIEETPRSEILASGRIGQVFSRPNKRRKSNAKMAEKINLQVKIKGEVNEHASEIMRVSL